MQRLTFNQQPDRRPIGKSLDLNRAAARSLSIVTEDKRMENRRKYNNEERTFTVFASVTTMVNPTKCYK